MTKPTIISFGIPRSGTTLIKKWLEVIPPHIAEVIALRETHELHPVQCEDGLIHMRRAFDDGPILFVYVTRNPVDIFKSFYAARKAVQEQHAEVIPTKMRDLTGIAATPDKRIFEMIDAVQQNVFRQRDEVQMITVDYRTLLFPAIVSAVVDDITSVMRPEDREDMGTVLNYWMAEHYGKAPVRAGKLSHGWDDVKLPRKLEKIIQRKYAAQ